jgi:hypothetical protein
LCFFAVNPLPLYRGSTRKVGTVDPPPAVTFTSASVRDARQAPVHVRAERHVGVRVQHPVDDVQRPALEARVRLVRQLHPLLDDVGVLQGRSHRGVPRALIDQPPEHDPLPAVVVVRLQHQAVAVRARPLHEVDFAPVGAERLPRLHHPRPRDVPRERLLLRRGEQGRVPLVGEHGQRRLLEQDFAPERVHHAHRPVAHRPHDGVVDPAALDQLADEHPLVDERDVEVAGQELAVAVLDLARVHDAGLDAHRLEVVVEDDELAERRHLAPVEDGDPRRLGRVPLPLPEESSSACSTPGRAGTGNARNRRWNSWNTGSP